MFKLFRKNESSVPVTVRVAELQVGDRLVYDTVEVEILDIIQNLDNGTRRLRFGFLTSKLLNRSSQVELYPEMLVIVVR